MLIESKSPPPTSFLLLNYRNKLRPPETTMIWWMFLVVDIIQYSSIEINTNGMHSTSCMNITTFQIITSYIFCVHNDSSVGWPWLICSQLTLPQVYIILCLLRVPKFKVVISRYQDLSISWPTFVSSYSCVKLFKGMVKFKIVILANLHIVILLSGPVLSISFDDISWYLISYHFQNIV